ncbi:MAG TPA: tetratricopeptide repeat protein [Phycisphaerales bacterium]|nr:tetratricopeptide repeat protein [Phycisphaerales bacterium]
MSNKSRSTTVARVLTIAIACQGLLGCRGMEERRAERRASRSASRADVRAGEAVDLGSRLREQGLLDQALREFERAIEINPTLTTAYMGAGDIYRERGDFESAEVQYREAVRTAPNEFDPNYWHGHALQMLNRITEAVRAYLRALAIRPEDFNANLNLATAYLQLGENAQAVIYAERAVRINPDDGPAHVNLGAAYANAGRHGEAIEQYEIAAELMPLGPELLLNLAESQGKVGRYAEMAGTINEVIRQQPTAPAYERLGSALFRMGRYDDALAAFHESARADERHYPAWNGIGVCLLNRYVWSGRSDLASLDEARDALRRSLQIERDQPRIAELLTRY